MIHTPKEPKRVNLSPDLGAQFNPNGTLILFQLPSQEPHIFLAGYEVEELAKLLNQNE